MTNAREGELRPWLQEARSWVDRSLEEFVPAEAEHPTRLHAAMRYALFGGGKRLRPALCRLTCHELGGDDEQAVRPAVAVELIHTYSLIHDDLPCMDDDDLRRGRATCHLAFDEATAILAGDGLLTLAFEVLAGDQGGRGAELAGILARAAGPAGMVGGQMLDLTLEPTAAGDPSVLADVHGRKTAALFSAAAEMGAAAAGSPPEKQRRSAAYGRILGLLFQAVDDLLDVVGDSETLGKTPGKDAALERPTWVSALGLEEARAKAREFAQAARQAAEELGGGPQGLSGRLVDYLLARQA